MLASGSSGPSIQEILKIEELVRDLGKWLTVLIPLVAGLMMAYHFIMKSAAQDEQAAAQHTRAIRTIAISAALGFSALLLVNWLLGPYILPSDF